MMTPQQLKNSILQRAIEGKLVEQRPEEGPAKELLKKIKAEKDRLVKEGKIKKTKPLPPITEDEIPFEIPESWEWCRLGDIISLLSGQDFPPNKYSDVDNNGIPYITGASSLSETGVIVCRWTKEPRCIAETGDLLLVCKGSGYGKTVICDIGKAHIARQIMAIKSRIMNLAYVMYFLQHDIKRIKQQGQGIIPGIDRQLVLDMIVPLPPLSEQHRIVAKIEELLPIVDEYDEAYSRLAGLNEKFPADMKKSILQYAIEGKLVEQRPEEGTASDLLKQIKAEKAKLIKEGKIKKEKTLPPITEDEIPFDIPENWVWCRLREVVFNRAQKKPDKTFCYIDIGSIDNVRQRLNSEDNVLEPIKAPSRARKIVEMGDILYSTVRPYLHNMCIVDRKFSYEPIASTGFAVLACTTGICNTFLFYYLLSPEFDRYANSNENAKGVAYPAINDERLYNAVIPLPPLSEQKRIVSKLEEFVSLCDKLSL